MKKYLLLSILAVSSLIAIAACRTPEAYITIGTDGTHVTHEGAGGNATPERVIHIRKKEIDLDNYASQGEVVREAWKETKEAVTTDDLAKADKLVDFLERIGGVSASDFPPVSRSGRVSSSGNKAIKVKLRLENMSRKQITLTSWPFDGLSLNAAAKDGTPTKKNPIVTVPEGDLLVTYTVGSDKTERKLVHTIRAGSEEPIQFIN